MKKFAPIVLLLLVFALVGCTPAEDSLIAAYENAGYSISYADKETLSGYKKTYDLNGSVKSKITASKSDGSIFSSRAEIYICDSSSTAGKLADELEKNLSGIDKIQTKGTAVAVGTASALAIFGNS